jgi:hypothetical protein
MAVIEKQKTNVDILFSNIIFYVIIFLSILLIASFGLIAEA